MSADRRGPRGGGKRGPARGPTKPAGPARGGGPAKGRGSGRGGDAGEERAPARGRGGAEERGAAGKGGARARGPARRRGPTDGRPGTEERRPRAPQRPANKPVRERPPKAEPMRIQRALARAGVASRRKAEELIAAGRVTVNGTTATTGQTVDPSRDEIRVDGTPLPKPVAVTWLLLHKPVGVLTTRHDPEGRPTIFDLVPDVPGLTYVGRLDFMTEGVLLLTTDGEAANALTHPSSGIERTYVATVRGNAVSAAARAQRGVELEDGPARALHAEAHSLGSRRWELELVLAEGRTREVRRLCEALDLTVERLVRERFGPISLGSLAPGAHRALTPRERQALATAVRAAGSARRDA